MECPYQLELDGKWLQAHKKHFKLAQLLLQSDFGQEPDVLGKTISLYVKLEIVELLSTILGSNAKVLQVSLLPHSWNSHYQVQVSLISMTSAMLMEITLGLDLGQFKELIQKWIILIWESSTVENQDVQLINQNAQNN